MIDLKLCDSHGIPYESRAEHYESDKDSSEGDDSSSFDKIDE